MFKDYGQPKIKGHLRIHEEETGKVLLDVHNDIHPENFSIALALLVLSILGTPEFAASMLAA